MADPRIHSTGWVEWGVAATNHPGETASGDLHLVQAYPDGVLVAAVDALGHGQEAAVVAQTATDILTSRSTGESLETIITRCHGSLKGTRGIVMSAAWFCAAADTMTWGGIGNVEGHLLRSHQDSQVTDPDSDQEGIQGSSPRKPHTGTFPDESLLLRGGVIGHQIPRFNSRVLPVQAGDTLIFTTDGIKSISIREIDRDKTPQELADSILATGCKGTDDALALVARYKGGGS